MENVEGTDAVVVDVAAGSVAEPNAEVTATPAKIVRKHLSALEFALVFNACNTAQEVSDKTGLPVASVHTKASGLRKKGVALKNFPRGGGKGRAKLDYAAINAALAAEKTEKTEDAPAA